MAAQVCQSGTTGARMIYLKSQGFPGLAHEPQVTPRGGEWQVGETLRGWQKRRAGGQVEWQLGWWDPRCSCL